MSPSLSSVLPVARGPSKPMRMSVVSRSSRSSASSRAIPWWYPMSVYSHRARWRP